jgi:hypothetical protein
VHGFLNFGGAHRASRDAVLHLAGVVRALLHGSGPEPLVDGERLGA